MNGYHQVLEHVRWVPLTTRTAFISIAYARDDLSFLRGEATLLPVNALHEEGWICPVLFGRWQPT